ncbi:MAG: amino acid adenylation domain-containing protein [Ktedonobacteraceae bacterium]|nr:amino acid adenylation domain-containing protein [Ktedonobacteraceae bacterium]
MNDASRKLAELSPQEKRALLAQLLRKKVEDAQRTFPLSQGQRALWFLYRLAPDSSAYNLLYSARIHAAIDVPALQHALQALIQRYPILTATYAMDGQEPVQRLHPDQQIPIEVIDASHWSEERLRQEVTAEGNRPFNLEQGPLLRLKLYPISAEETVLCLTLHHIITDLWSLDLLIDELSLLYAARTAGMQVQLPPAGAQFTDYIRWQNELLASAEGERHWRYWQQKLAGEPPVLHLPTDRPRPPVQTYKGASHSFRLDDAVTKQLRALAYAEKVTLFTLVLAVFKVLLYRYTDQEDLLIGTPTLGRNHAGQEKIIGYLANPVALRTSFAGNPTFKDLLLQVRQTVIEALEHQDFPFPLLVERLQPKRDPSYSPFIQALFIWDKPRAHGAEAIAELLQNSLDGTATRVAQVAPQFESFISGQQGAHFDLSLTIFEVDGSLSGDFHYNTDLFDASTLARMEQHFKELLSSVVAHPEQRVLELPMLTEQERQQILIEWNNTQSEFPDNTCVHRLFEAQVERTPDAVAVVFGCDQLTYDELNRRANRVAHALQTLGVGPDTLVGVHMERSIEMVVALLAVLKAGGAYVPLEPSYPRERLLSMIEDAGLKILLTQPHLGDQLPHDNRHILYLENELCSLSQNEENPVSAVQPDNLIYMIYTSGSTGKPKGVMNIHRALCNRLHWMQQAYRLTAEDRVLQKTPFGFDVAGWEFFWPLLNGARLVVARPRGHQDPAYLLALIEEQQITTMHFVPSMLQAFLEQPGLERGRCASLKRVICSGEALSVELQKRFFASLDADLYNLYGPTEAAIDVSHWTCRRDSAESSVPIGHPIANTQLYILNRTLQPVPVGIAGELHIGGVGLARGYHNRPELTAEKFIPDPFSQQPGARLYKTGDLARYRADGAIEFLGRIDHQVKIRGVRIELGEIETVLAQHPAIKEVVVTARDDTPGKRLVAYLVPNPAYSGQRPGVEELRAYLKERLPQDMLPAAFVFLEALPISPNGKVDRSALPAPDTARPELEAAFVAPRTPLEEQLARIWAEVLGIDRVGIHDNFFDLGGASIQSLQVIAKAEEAGIHLAPEQIFEHQTIAELAAVAGKAPAASNGHDAAREQQKRRSAVHIPSTADLHRPSRPYQPAQPDYGHMHIESIGVYLPPKIVSTKEVLAQCHIPIKFPLEQLTGIKNRRMAGETEFSVDLAAKAIEHCFSNSKYRPEDIDLLICSNISRYNGPDFQVSFEPNMALQLQRRCGLTNALAFDVSNACTGMFTAMYIVDAFLKAGLIRRGMVVSGEYITHLTKTAQKEIEGYLDSRMACLTVGDAGAAVILDTTADTKLGFHEFEMYTLGRYYDLCIARATDKDHGGAIMYTDSVKVSAVNIQHAVSHAARVIERSGWPKEAFQHIIMHQTSKMTIYDAGREINSYFGEEICHDGNLINNIAERGNTATTTHFVALMDQILAGRIRSDSNIVFGITGSGVNIGTAIYTFDDLPDRLRRAATGSWQPEKIAPAREKFVALLPRTQRVRVASIGTLPLIVDGKRESLEMAKAAALRSLQASPYSRNDIDLLIYTGVYRDDFISEPALASIVAGQLEINDTIQSQEDKKTFAFDLFNGASGVLNACYTAVGMMQSKKAATAMIVTAEIENNREILPNMLRGIEETASALILDYSPDGQTGFGNFVFKHFPEYIGAVNTHTMLRDGKTCLYVEQDAHVEQYYQRCIRETVLELLRIEQLDLSRIKLILPPQISSSFIDGLSDIMEVDRSKFVDLHTQYDLFTSSLPYALQAVHERNLAQPGDIGLFIAVGAGIQVGCATYYW